MKEHKTVSAADFALLSPSEALELLKTSEEGLDEKGVRASRNEYGTNNVTDYKKDTVLFRLKRAFINPFSIVLFTLACISFLSDIQIIKHTNRHYASSILIMVMLFISGFIRFVQEMNSRKITDALTKLVNTVVETKRCGKWSTLNSGELAAGDIVHLTAGVRVPADIRLLDAVNCYVSQGVITGESSIVEKTPEKLFSLPRKTEDCRNIIFMGSTIMGGECSGVVAAVGRNTLYGRISPSSNASKKGFDKGANSIAWVLIRFMALLVPVVFILNVVTKDDWITAFLFSLSVAVGLTPELLPMVITACLTKGSFNMKRKQTVVKNINAMQGFGSMDLLCIDKTGTLTRDALSLEYYMDVLGNEESSVLDYAYLSSFYSSGVKNLLDSAVLEISERKSTSEHYTELSSRCSKAAELPFDYNRKISSVLVKEGEKFTLISKGSIEEIYGRCTSIEYKGRTIDITKESEMSIHSVVDEMVKDGIKILAVAVKHMDKEELLPEDERELSLLGYIAFFDAPKKSASSAIRKLRNLNVEVKILTGDAKDLTVSVCRRLGIETSRIMTGSEFEELSDNVSQVKVEETVIFAELNPRQKAEIVGILQSNGHKVGFLGDGINDLPAILGADVGISVDNAAPTVKEAADVILLRKDLDVLEEGILEGRKAFVNMSKYVKITASSNLGNIISIVIASLFLPFFPVTALQLLLLNLSYDTLCLVLPWDYVDTELCSTPLEWSGAKLSRFMLFFGPLSCIFDIVTFAFLFYVLCPRICGGGFFSLDAGTQSYFISIFHTGWFLESMWTQVMILHLLRTKKIPVLQSKTSPQVTAVTIAGIFLLTFAAMTPAGEIMGLTHMEGGYFIFLSVVVASYLLIVTLAKKIYVDRNSELI